MPASSTAARPFIRERRTGPFWYAKWRRDGKQVMRAVGPAWVRSDGEGGWKSRRGQPVDGALTEAHATERMLQLRREHDAEQTDIESRQLARQRGGVTFRELAAEWLVYLEREKGVKPSTLANYRWMLAEPGTPHRRGSGRTPGVLLAEFGDQPAREITARAVARFLRQLDDDGASVWTVNKYRQVICAAFNFGMRDDTFALAGNPGAGTNKRREPPPAVLDFYEPEEVELIARAAARGAHRWVAPLLVEVGARRTVQSAARIAHVSLAAVAAEIDVNPAFAERLGAVAGAGPAIAELALAAEDRPSFSEQETAARLQEDRQDADLYRIAAYTGLRLGELRALQWGDVDLATRRIVVHRAVSGHVDGPTKSWQARYVPLADAAVDAFERLADRVDFTSADDLVFCSRLGRRLDAASIRRRFKRASAAAGLRVLKFHALRHGTGSLIARQADPRWVQGFLGHSKLATTERYLHAKARPEDVATLNRAFAPRSSQTAGSPGRNG